jgi:hypothetical protein
MSTLKVDGIRSNSASSDAITLASDGTCTANITNNLSNRNLIINGAMQVAQRGTSSTTSGYGDVDRWQHEYAGTDEAPTFAQVEVVSSDSGDNPFAKGFSNCARITNGNQTSGLQAASQINFMQPIEAQNIRNSGWNYNSSSSYITLSYYVKASVAQEYHGFVKTADGSNYVYPFSLGSLSANTWTKITKTIPGNSNLQIDNNNGAGFQVWPVALYGTDYTDSGVNNDAWASWASSSRNKDNTSTWWTTNDSTFEITGVQLEVGSVATDFEHRSYGQELQLCKRYYQQHVGLQISGGFIPTTANKAQQVTFVYPSEMRSAPSISIANTGSSGGQYIYDGSGYSNIASLDSSSSNVNSCHMNFSLDGDLTDTRTPMLGGATQTTWQTTYKFSSEL